MLHTLQESDLGRSQEWLDAMHSARLSRGDETPIETVLDTVAGVVRRYTARYELERPHFIRLAKPLAIYELTCDPKPQSVIDDYERAMRELVDIRDGKFGGLPLAESPTAPLANTSGAYGSQTRIAIRRE